MSTVKTCLVTGSSSGVGEGLARAFLTQGYRVFGFDIQAATIEDENFTHLFVDVTDEKAIEQAFDQIYQQAQHLDVLINNAGMQRIAALDQFELAEWQRVIELNLTACFLVSKVCLQRMKQHPALDKAIINIGSIHSFEASPHKSAYIAAKHGLVGLTRSLAVEGAEFNVKANLIGPGFVKTPLVEAQIPRLAEEQGISEAAVQEMMLAKTLDKRFTTVDEINRVALFLAEFPSLALTGQSMLVSHGQNMR